MCGEVQGHHLARQCLVGGDDLLAVSRFATARKLDALEEAEARHPSNWIAQYERTIVFPKMYLLIWCDQLRQNPQEWRDFGPRNARSPNVEPSSRPRPKHQIK
jgi:hypothetical protein